MKTNLTKFTIGHGAKWPFVLLIFMLSFGSMQAQIVGANFNERIHEIDQAELADSKVSWVRAFINITALTTKANVNGTVQITGINQTAMNNYNAASLSSVSQMSSGTGETVKLIISLKYNFKDALGRVPGAFGTEADYLAQATLQILEKASLGSHVDILVVGNEPMWETPTGTTDINNLEAFTNRMIDEVDVWKSNHSNWTYDIYVGALNRFSDLPTNTIRNRILNIAKNNSKVDGLDLHSHVATTTEIVEDFKQLRVDNNFTKGIICTEYSLFRMFENHKNDNLGTWGANNGYTSGMKMWEWVNVLLTRSNNNNPASANHFISYFNSTGWYPQNWFQQFYNAFIDYDVKVATYGFVRDKLPGEQLNQNTAIWVLNALRNEALLGSTSGLANKNPLNYPTFKEVVGPFSLEGAPLQVLSVNSGQAMDVQGCSTANGANVQQWPWNGNLCQQWTFNFKRAGEYEIRSVKSNLALDLQGGSTANGANIRQWTPNGAPAQTWLVQPLGNNQYRIISKKSGKSLDVAGCSTSDGANIQQWTWGGADCQKWSMQAVSNARMADVTDVKIIDDNKLSVFPNPVAGEEFYVRSDLGEARIIVLDLSGRTVFEQRLQESVAINTSDFMPGTYVVRVVSADQTYERKLVIR